MGPKTGQSMMLAPGASTSTPLHCPGAEGPDAWPAVSDHLVEPEVTRDAMIRGRRVVAMPAHPPHADRQAQLAYVLGAHARPGYVMSTELLTRGPRSDFATDVCIRQAGQDPETGQRYLEELAFEVVSEQHPGDILAKAEDMAARGVRRVFAVFVKTGEVKEWLGAWRALPPSGIEDPALARPLPVKAILDAAEADDAVIRALAAKGNRALAEREDSARQAGEVTGEVKGQQQALLTVLVVRGFPVPPEVRARILATRDLDALQRWIALAVAAATLQDALKD